MKRISSISDILKMKGFWIYEVIDRQSFLPNKAFLVALEFVFPPLLIFLIPAVQRLSNIQEYSLWRILSLLSAASWSFLGPFLIYHYHLQIIKLYQNLSPLQSSLKKNSMIEIFQNTYANFQRRVMQTSFLWGIILAWILIRHPETLYPYSLYGYADSWYWIFLLYVFFSLHLTDCGFVGVIYSILLLKKLIKSDIMPVLLQKKPRKLKTIGQFSFSIVLYFSSGIAFIPILIDFIRANTSYSQFGITLGIGLYTTALCVAFIYPVYIVKQSAKKAKESLLNKFESEYIQCIYYQKSNKRSFAQNLYQANRYNSLCFIQSINVELLDSSKIFTVFTTLILPTVLGILEKMFSSNQQFTALLSSLFSN